MVQQLSNQAPILQAYFLPIKIKTYESLRRPLNNNNNTPRPTTPPQSRTSLHRLYNNNSNSSQLNLHSLAQCNPITLVHPLPTLKQTIMPLLILSPRGANPSLVFRQQAPHRVGVLHPQLPQRRRNPPVHKTPPHTSPR